MARKPMILNDVQDETAEVGADKAANGGCRAIGIGEENLPDPAHFLSYSCQPIENPYLLISPGQDQAGARTDWPCKIILMA